MKYITRELKIYRYSFGKINIDDKSVYGVFTHETATPLSKRAIGKICEENDGAVLLDKTVTSQKFAMPIDKFVEECRAYNVADIPQEDLEGDETDED